MGDWDPHDSTGGLEQVTAEFMKKLLQQKLKSTIKLKKFLKTLVVIKKFVKWIVGTHKVPLGSNKKR